MDDQSGRGGSEENSANPAVALVVSNVQPGKENPHTPEVPQARGQRQRESARVSLSACTGVCDSIAVSVIFTPTNQVTEQCASALCDLEATERELSLQNLRFRRGRCYAPLAEREARDD